MYLVYKEHKLNVTFIHIVLRFLLKSNVPPRGTRQEVRQNGQNLVS